MRPDHLPSEGNFTYKESWFDLFRELTSNRAAGGYSVTAGLYREPYFLKSYQEIAINARRGWVPRYEDVSREPTCSSAALSGIQTGELAPRPDFQRKLVWSNKDKIAFLDTVLRGYPFPEIYIAVGDVNLETAAGTEMLVDGPTDNNASSVFHGFFST